MQKIKVRNRSFAKFAKIVQLERKPKKSAGVENDFSSYSKLGGK